MRLALGPLLLVLAACQEPAPATEPPRTDPPMLEVLWDVTGAGGKVVGADLVLTVGVETSTPGWSELELVPVTYIQAPPDGIYDVTALGLPPTGVVAQVLTAAEVTLSRPVAGLPRAFRIHAAQSCLVVLLTQPEPAPDIRDCRVVRIPGLPIR